MCFIQVHVVGSIEEVKTVSIFLFKQHGKLFFFAGGGGWLLFIIALWGAFNHVCSKHLDTVTDLAEVFFV